MQTNITNPTTADQIRKFNQYRSWAIGERLTMLNHAKQQFAEMAEKLQEAQQQYNNSLIFSYSDYSRLPNETKSNTFNEEVMKDLFANMSTDTMDDDIHYLKTNIPNLTKAIIFLHSHAFDIDLTAEERDTFKTHLLTLSEYRANIISSLMLDDATASPDMPSIMNSTLDELTLIMYEYLTHIDTLQQEQEQAHNEELANELADAHTWLYEKIKFLNQVDIEPTAEERNQIRAHIKHYTRVHADILGEVNP